MTAYTVPKDNTAYGSVQIMEKTTFGKVLFKAKYDSTGEIWYVLGEYPAIGVDSVEYELGQTTIALDSVRKLRQWTANHFEVIETATASARSRRYILRQEMLGG